MLARVFLLLILIVSGAKGCCMFKKPIGILDCMDCNLSKVPFYQKYGSSVLYLDLQKNNITEITQNVSAVYPNLISVDARGNQYICGGLKVSGIKVRSNCPTEIRHNITISETANPTSTLIPIASTTYTQLSFKSTTTLISVTSFLQPSSSRPEALSPSAAVTSFILLPTSELTPANIVITLTNYPDSTSIFYLANFSATDFSSSSTILMKPTNVAISQPKQLPILLISISTTVCAIFIIGFLIKFKRYLCCRRRRTNIYSEGDGISLTLRSLPTSSSGSSTEVFTITSI